MQERYNDKMDEDVVECGEMQTCKQVGSKVQMGGDYHFGRTLAYVTPFILEPRMVLCTL